MPWKERTVERLREEFVLASKERKQSFSSLCREFGITRKTGYKWVQRAQEGDEMKDRSRRPGSTPQKTDCETEKLILNMRKENPAWGGKKIRYKLEQMGYENLPCVKTFNNILKRNHCIDTAESAKHKPFQRFEREQCNELWQADFKGDFPLFDGSRCYPLTILDDHSRFSIAVKPRSSLSDVKDSFREAFYTYGMPESILSDNGGTFRGLHGGYTQFERWLMDHNILPIHGRVMHPQTQGKIERFHRTMNQELIAGRQFNTLQEVDACMQEWRRKYNEDRPHEALGMRTPAEVYTPSEREYKEQVPQYEYSGNHHIIKVNNWGYLRYDRFQVYLSETMANVRLEIRANQCGDFFIVCYRNFKIAEIDADTGKLITRRISRI